MAWSDPHEVPADAAGRRFVDYLKERLIAVPVNEIGDAITGGAITLAGRTGAKPGAVLAAGDRIVIDAGLEMRLGADNRLTPPADIPLRIAHEDAFLLIAEKPAGMHVHPLGAWRDATLLNALVRHAGARPGNPWGAWRPHPAHRLDRPVSGLVIVAKSAGVRDALQSRYERDAIVRRYLAWVTGSPAEDRGVVDLPVGRDPEFDYRRGVVPVEQGGKTARTKWWVRERRENPVRALLELELETGRTHQIRVHLAAIGHPVRGDTLYTQAPAVHAPDPGRTAAGRIALHSWRVAFVHPMLALDVDASAEPPPGFDAIE